MGFRVLHLGQQRGADESRAQGRDAETVPVIVIAQREGKSSPYLLAW